MRIWLFLKWRSRSDLFGFGLFRLGQGRRLGNCLIPLDDQMPQNGVAKLECTLNFIKRGLLTLDIHQNAVCLVQFGDRMGELPAAPVLTLIHISEPTRLR